MANFFRTASVSPTPLSTDGEEWEDSSSNVRLNYSVVAVSTHSEYINRERNPMRRAQTLANLRTLQHLSYPFMNRPVSPFPLNQSDSSRSTRESDSSRTSIAPAENQHNQPSGSEESALVNIANNTAPLNGNEEAMQLAITGVPESDTSWEQIIREKLNEMRPIISSAEFESFFKLIDPLWTKPLHCVYPNDEIKTRIETGIVSAMTDSAFESEIDPLKKYKVDSFRKIHHAIMCNDIQYLEETLKSRFFVFKYDIHYPYFKIRKFQIRLQQLSPFTNDYPKFCGVQKTSTSKRQSTIKYAKSYKPYLTMIEKTGYLNEEYFSIKQMIKNKFIKEFIQACENSEDNITKRRIQNKTIELWHPKILLFNRTKPIFKIIKSMPFISEQ